jgi:long-chain acyl-CoA synthetase
MKKESILITGSLGSFGRILTKEIISTGYDINLLVRGKSDLPALTRTTNVFGGALPNTVRVFPCELKEKNLGLSKKDYRFLAEETTHVLHAAASTRFDLTISEARNNNVETVKNILAFSENCGLLKKLGFISTAFVAGKRKGNIYESELEHNEGFLNTYEESKYEAEKIIQCNMEKLPIIIFRPSIITTAFNKHENNPMNAVIFALKLIKRGMLPILPGEETNKLDIVPANTAAKKISKLFFKEANLHSVYHIVSSSDSPTIRDLLTMASKTSNQKIQIKFCGDITSFKKEVEKAAKFFPEMIPVYQKTAGFIPELAFPKLYDDSNVSQELTSGNNHQKNTLEAIAETIL